jgi:hypothetical protein
MGRPTATNTPGTSANPSTDAIEQRVVAFAEQLGRLVGTVQAKADGWMDVPALQEQVTRIRDGAAGLLRQLGDAGARGKAAAAATRKPQKPTMSTAGRSGGKVDAPGKKHRKPAASTPGVKHSNEMIAKGTAARQRRRTGSNRG